jgi:hypothetical protein
MDLKSFETIQILFKSARAHWSASLSLFSSPAEQHASPPTQLHRSRATVASASSPVLPPRSSAIPSLFLSPALSRAPPPPCLCCCSPPPTELEQAPVAISVMATPGPCSEPHQPAAPPVRLITELRSSHHSPRRTLNFSPSPSSSGPSGLIVDVPFPGCPCHNWTRVGLYLVLVKLWSRKPLEEPSPPATPGRRSAACGAHRGQPEKSHHPGVIQTLPGYPLLAPVRCAGHGRTAVKLR